jgi:RHS repeat-associated protein
VVNTSGAVLDQLTYDPFGGLVSETNATNGDRFKYAGGAYDSITGQYQFGARYYGPSDGRFESQDPLLFGAGDTNLYRYVFNAPTNANDPTGQSGLTRGSVLMGLPSNVYEERAVAKAEQECVDYVHFERINDQYEKSEKTVILINGYNNEEMRLYSKYAEEYWPKADIYTCTNAEELECILSQYENGSIGLLIIGAHGREDGAGDENGTVPITPTILAKNPALAEDIASKLAKGAIVDFQACRIATYWGIPGLQVVANVLQATVIANTNDVSENGIDTIPGWGAVDPGTGYRVPQAGTWVEVQPSR